VLSAKKKRRASRAKDEALSEVTREETMRLNADVPVSLHRRVKLQAAQEGKSITEILITALETYLRKYSNE
jgi:predicted HicB family RNase H-like nuclease